MKEGVKDWHELAIEYQAMPDEDRRTFAEDGQLAATRHRLGMPAFGPSKRSQLRQRLHNMAIAFERMHPLPICALEVDSSSDMVISLPQTNTLEVHTMLQVARLVGSAQARNRREEEEAMIAKITAYAVGAGQSIVDATVQSCSNLAPFSASMASLPHQFRGAALKRLLYLPDTEGPGSAAVAVAASERQKHKANNLLKALDAYWAARCCPVSGDDWRGGSPGGSPKDTTRCYELGHCVCGEEGRRLLRFRNSCLAAIKQLFPKQTARRTLLADGMVVLRFRGLPVEPMLPDEDAACEAEYKFLHIAMMTFSPYYPVFQDMHCKDLDTEVTIGDHDEVLLEASRCVLFFSRRQSFESFAKSAIATECVRCPGRRQRTFWSIATHSLPSTSTTTTGT